ncbi:MAG: permease prefix domain 1-containing protein [Acidobacteriota bacterium]
MGDGDPALERQIDLWRDYLCQRAAIHPSDVGELEDHLRTEIGELRRAGLSGEEAFLVAVKRLGNLDALSRDFAREHSERLWKQLVPGPGPGTHPKAEGVTRREPIVVVCLASAAALLFKAPELFGYHLLAGDFAAQSFYARNVSLFVLPFLAGYFLWKRRSRGAAVLPVVLSFVAAILFANVYPLRENADTLGLTVLHLPIALWLTVGVAYVGGRWRRAPGRMDFARFSGELFIYYTLIALGGVVLSLFTALMFDSIGLNAKLFVSRWLLPCGALGAVIIGSWLVEAKQSVIENMAPVLTRIFTPLFAAALLAFLGAMAWTGSVIDVQRNVLIGLDLLLAVVLGLVLYAVSARDPAAPVGTFDRLQLLLVVCALAVDVVALASIAARIQTFGWSPNKVAALGENVVLLINLAGSAWLYTRFLRNQESFAAVERWQIAYLPVYSLWAWLVVVVFPPLFAFR